MSGSSSTSRYGFSRIFASASPLKIFESLSAAPIPNPILVQKLTSSCFPACSARLAEMRAKVEGPTPLTWLRRFTISGSLCTRRTTSSPRDFEIFAAIPGPMPLIAPLAKNAIASSVEVGSFGFAIVAASNCLPNLACVDQAPVSVSVSPTRVKARASALRTTTDFERTPFSRLRFNSRPAGPEDSPKDFAFSRIRRAIVKPSSERKVMDESVPTMVSSAAAGLG
mmetsp:Transcript_37960/g.94169  ORF Transcript_37960/g.94169 Transcript_37960/m.94169 type:complete len:225 (-) Transcript_37960:172-846(-)